MADTRTLDAPGHLARGVVVVEDLALADAAPLGGVRVREEATGAVADDEGSVVGDGWVVLHSILSIKPGQFQEVQRRDSNPKLPAKRRGVHPLNYDARPSGGRRSGLPSDGGRVGIEGSPRLLTSFGTPRWIRTTDRRLRRALL